MYSRIDPALEDDPIFQEEIDYLNHREQQITRWRWGSAIGIGIILVLNIAHLCM